jgi:two-component system response regulator QseB/two-component system response regulator TctD
MRLLLAEDSKRLQELLADALRKSAYRVDVVASVAGLMSSVAAVDYSLIIVDRGLTDGDGLDAVRAIRAAKAMTPILIITARGNVDDRVLGLDSGADDYLSKPFNNAEFLARVRSLLRRPPNVLEVVLRVGQLEFDQASGKVRIAGESVELRLSERRLLALLMRQAGSIVAKTTIEDALSGFGRELTSNAVEVLVSRLRKFIDGPQTGLVIETVRGVGYLLRDVAHND